tara:strand:- start:766 stop:990 length:225 start_codon:yes stop_codon:yes gene_type:complete
MSFDDISKSGDIIEVCSNCFSPRIAPYMGYETGKRFICQDCDSISMVTIEFKNIESLVEFLKEKREKESNVDDS